MPDSKTSCRISVLMPVYNGGRFLRLAVESILAQSCRDFELIAIDDGSTDESSAYLEDVGRADARVRVFHQENQGLVATLNRALHLAESPLVARMDADDIAEVDRLEKQAKLLAENHKIAAAGSAITLIDDEGQSIRVRRYPETSDAIRAHLEKDAALAHPSVMMRRDCVLAVGGYRPAFKHVEDYDLWLRLSEKYDLVNLPEPLLRYRIHDSKVSARYAADQIVGRRMAQFSASQRRGGRTDRLNDVSLSLEDHLAGSEALPFTKAAACDLMLAYVRTNDPMFRDKLGAVLAALSRGGLSCARVCQRLLRSARPGVSVRNVTVSAAMCLLLRPPAILDLLRLVITQVRRPA